MTSLEHSLWRHTQQISQGNVPERRNSSADLPNKVTSASHLTWMHRCPKWKKTWSIYAITIKLSTQAPGRHIHTAWKCHLISAKLPHKAEIRPRSICDKQQTLFVDIHSEQPTNKNNFSNSVSLKSKLRQCYWFPNAPQSRWATAAEVGFRPTGCMSCSWSSMTECSHGHVPTQEACKTPPI